MNFDAFEDGEEIPKFLSDKSWVEVASSSEFQASRLAIIDLGNLTQNLTRCGILYFLPGFLIHFYRWGLYEKNVWGPTFYFNFVRRLQADDADVLKAGGSEIYFSLSAEQKHFCAELMRGIYTNHGDPYERFVNLGFEYYHIAMLSMARALNQYWDK